MSPNQDSTAQEVADSLQAAIDSLQTSADSLQAAADTSQGIGAISDQINQGVTEAGRLLVEGEWDLLYRQTQQGLFSMVADFFPKLVSAVLVFLVLYFPYRLIRSLLKKLFERSRRIDEGLQNLLLKTFKVVALVLIAVIVLSEFGINVTALLAGLSIAGIAVGFAAKDTLENFISGVTIMLDRPFRIGDHVVVDSTYGSVEEITLRSTRIRTKNNEIMVMPNVQMVNQKVVNHSLKNYLRVEIPFGIAYKELPEEAREILLKLPEGDSRIMETPSPAVVVTAMNSSSVDMKLWLYLHRPSDKNQVTWDYTEKILQVLREADIEVPFPHLQLFIDSAKAFEQSFLMREDIPLLNLPPDSPAADEDV